jgi:hypothetical protein
MKRIIVLTMLALALPGMALASGVDYQGFGTSASGTASLSGSVSSGGSLDLTMELTGINSTTGNLGTVTFTPTLGTSCGTGCFNITGGLVSVVNNSSVSLFSSAFTSGTVTQSGNFINVQGFLANGSTVSTVMTISGGGIITSSNTIVAPEPGTLGLLGTGMVGLAGFVRRKMRA